jgi:hypothetical protein
MDLKRKIILGALIAGTSDAVAAVLLYSNPVNLHNASRIFRYIASSVFGAQAGQGSRVFPFIGLAIHFLIAAVWTALYVLWVMRAFKPGSLCLKIILYACAIWVIMNGWVMPLAGMKAQNPGWSIMRSFTVILFCVSLPICLIGEMPFKRKREV